MADNFSGIGPLGLKILEYAREKERDKKLKKLDEAIGLGAELTERVTPSTMPPGLGYITQMPRYCPNYAIPNRVRSIDDNGIGYWHNAIKILEDGK